MVEAKPKLHPQVRYTVVKNEGVVIAQDEGEVHIVNEVASFLLPLLDGTRLKKDIIRLMVDEYDVEEETAWGDLEDFLDELQKHNLIQYES